MAAEIAQQTPRRGRPCAVCALAPQQRLNIETALASGTSISRIARQHWAPGRDSIRHHLDSGHLRSDLQERAERATGLDHTTVVARISDIAERARTAALEAAEAGDRAGVLKAGDSELRALSALTSAGETSEREIAMSKAHRDMSVAVLRVARRDGATAEIIAAELDVMFRPDVADDIREQVPEMREVSA